MDYNNNYQNPNDGCLDWEGEIENDASFRLLPEGDHQFFVAGFKRDRYQPHEKSRIPACNMAVVSIMVDGVELEENFPLHTKMEWKLSQFFGSIALKQKGERTQMRWNEVTGKTGWLRIKHRQYTKRDNTPGTAMDIDRFYPTWDNEHPSNKPQQAQTQTQPQQMGGWQSKGWTAGGF